MRMTERLLIDLMSDLEFGLLEDQYMERDLLNQKQAVKKRRWIRKKAMKRGAEFALTDSLRTAVYEQRELIDTMVAHPVTEETLTEKFNINMDVVKKKVNAIIAIVSAIVSIIVVVTSVILVLIKKKSIAKLFGKRVQTAC